MLLHDSAALVAAYFVFASLRYGDSASAPVWQDVAMVAAIAVALQAVIGILTHVYRHRHLVASLEEIVDLAATTMFAGLATGLINAFVVPDMIARAVPVAATPAALLVMVGSRVAWRHFWDRTELRGPSRDARPTIIYGAGSGGRQLLRSMLGDPTSPYTPVGFLDDDKGKGNLEIHGVRVLGTGADLEKAVRNTGATKLIVAIPSADGDLIRRASEAARELGIGIKVLPGVNEMFNRPISIRDVRDINVADLLGRTRIDTDVSAVAGYLTNRRVLVTGAGGSIGSELARQIHKWGPSELMLLDRDESALHGVQLSLHGRAMLDTDEVILADIRDTEALQRIFSERQPEVVFHAAALKHLPMLEQYPSEALKTNVHGTLNVLEAAAAVGVTHFVNISTDKAADPSSVLGLSKRVAERLTADVARRTPEGTYLSVRFGNVLGSRGSVLTAFAAQIAAGGPVTVTHPDVTRYFMTVEEAVELVIQAAAIGSDGEALILDMGQPVRIVEVAEQLIAQSGEDIEIVFTGLREGEKMHEVLLGGGEDDERPKHPLVSHVDVEPLEVVQIRNTGSAGPPAARRLMQGWAGVGGTASRTTVEA
ncbi:polysaccharide biosynthesis protein [Nocardioides massiliensis]|uniref:FlaA1/EpsC-like NDP-sugar epimerase n=1 Tax=Nocardioides massiliensis TaxID=1325935 RepID=A0ABT9NPR5_9ACTN|nr:nucleoside-diphosphate sugar epimerase/dehydratase [Nocardioides massiliensis]MDP9821840.1 FlaA1/EpsC-like NDP-sugar epimerase [Nocardioides massiliensis]